MTDKEEMADPMREVQRLGQEIEQEPVGMVKDLFTSTAWERLDLRGSTKVYLATPPQRTEQEPVVYLKPDLSTLNHSRDCRFHDDETYCTCYAEAEHELEFWRSRAITPPAQPAQRTWVGLTDEDMYVVSEEESCSFIAGAKWSEAILKEKNA